MVMRRLTSAGRTFAMRNIEASIKAAYDSGRIERLPEGKFKYLDHVDGTLKEMTADELAAHIWLIADKNAQNAAGSPAINLGYFNITQDDVKESLLKADTIPVKGRLIDKVKAIPAKLRRGNG